MGWTLTELRDQPARFIEILTAYLAAVDDQQIRERGRANEELQSRLRGLRL
jgi:hypothetical protein